MEKGFVTCENEDTMPDIIRRCIRDRTRYLNSDDAFCLTDLGYHVDMVDKWKQLLPGITPYFAVKSEPDPVLLRMMAQMNLGFDCASKGEIELVVGLGVRPSRIIYAHPRKQPSHLEYASAVGVTLTVFDDEDELHKIKRIAPDMKMLLRISTEGFTKTTRAGMVEQFGCPKSRTKNLLKLAKELGLDVCGVSFHIGVRPESFDVYAQAIREARAVFREGLDLGFGMKVLDIGGGLPCDMSCECFSVSFEEVAKIIDAAIRKEFNDENIEIISEPGAFLTLPSSVLVVNIIGKKQHKVQDDGVDKTENPSKRQRTEGDSGNKMTKPSIEYFVNDGVFSSLGSHAPLGIQLLVKPVNEQEVDQPDQLYNCCIWGQTLGGDIVNKGCKLPNLKTGDWLYFLDTGGYCHSVTSAFNGFSAPPVYHFIRKSAKDRLDQLITDKPFSFK